MTNDDYACFDTLPDALFLQANGRLLYANPMARELFAIGYGDVSLIAVDQLFPDAEAGDDATREQPMRRLDGMLFDAELSTGTMRTPSGEDAVVMIVRDVSERRRTAHDAEQVRRTAAIRRAAYSIAHEFNNVLMGAGTFATVVARKLGDDDKGVQGMRTALERGRLVTAEVLRYARETELAFHEVEVEEWLRGLVASAAERVAPSTLQLRIDDAPVTARIDRVQLGEAVTALLLRASHTMPAGAAIEIVARRAAAALEITVTDRGVLSSEAREQAFEPSFSTKKTDALNLAMAHQIVLRHGGRMSLSSDDHGTRVTLIV